MTDRQGNTVPRPAWDLLRGIVAGTCIVDNLCYIVIVCQQNMGEILCNSSTHKTKRRFYIQDDGKIRYPWMQEPIWKFNARVVVFEFVEFFTLGNYLFEQLYPHLEKCQIAGVKLRKLGNTACLKPIVQSLPADENKSAIDYIRAITDDLQPVQAEFALDERIIW